MQSAQSNYQGVWGNRIGFGQRPALLVIDFLKGYTTEGAPLYAPGVVDAVAQTPALIDAAREAGIPIIHTRILYLAEDCADGGMWVKKSPVMKGMVEGNVLAEFCDGVEPASGELVIVKQYASAFFGTSLASQLHAQGIDTVIMAGCSTSGCIRATAVDAVQHGFRGIVVRE
ncbi:isochorismatase family protein, partial [Rhizobium leguminosarum]